MRPLHAGHGKVDSPNLAHRRVFRGVRRAQPLERNSERYILSNKKSPRVVKSEILKISLEMRARIPIRRVEQRSLDWVGNPNLAHWAILETGRRYKNFKNSLGKFLRFLRVVKSEIFEKMLCELRGTQSFPNIWDSLINLEKNEVSSLIVYKEARNCDWRNLRFYYPQDYSEPADPRFSGRETFIFMEICSSGPS